MVGAVLAIPAQTPTFFPAKMLWTEPAGPTLAAPPAFSAASAFLPLADGHLAAVDLSTRHRDWIADAAPIGRPVVGDARIYIVEDRAVVALHVADGSRAWRVPIDEPLSPFLAWDNGWLIAATEAGTLLSYRASDGVLVWRRDLNSPLHAPASFASDRVYVPLNDGRVAALQVETGVTRWERRLAEAPNDILALDDRVFVGSLDNYFYCFDARDGRTVWRWRTGGDVIGLPLVDDARVYFVSYDNVLRALDRRSGSQQWRRSVPIRPTRGPVRLLNTIVVSGAVATVQAYSAKDGQPAGSIDTGGTIVGGPQVVSLEGAALPVMAVVTTDLVKGAALAAFGQPEKDAGTPVAAPPAPVIGVGSLAPAASAWRR